METSTCSSRLIRAVCWSEKLMHVTLVLRRGDFLSGVELSPAAPSGDQQRRGARRSSVGLIRTWGLTTTVFTNCWWCANGRAAIIGVAVGGCCCCCFASSQHGCNKLIKYLPSRELSVDSRVQNTLSWSCSLYGSTQTKHHAPSSYHAGWLTTPRWHPRCL